MSNSSNKDDGIGCESMEIRLHVELRSIDESDLHKNLFELLSQLSIVGSLSHDFFEKHVASVRESPLQAMVVAEDTAHRVLCGSATLVVEPKFIRNTGFVGHLEDVVVEFAVRRQHIGSNLVKKLLAFARHRQCYKVIVDCSEDNVSFYEACGFKRKDVSLVRYIEADQHPIGQQGLTLEQVTQPSETQGMTLRLLQSEDYNRFVIVMT